MQTSELVSAAIGYVVGGAGKKAPSGQVVDYDTYTALANQYADATQRISDLLQQVAAGQVDTSTLNTSQLIVRPMSPCDTVLDGGLRDNPLTGLIEMPSAVLRSGVSVFVQPLTDTCSDADWIPVKCAANPDATPVTFTGATGLRIKMSGSGLMGGMAGAELLLKLSDADRSDGIQDIFRHPLSLNGSNVGSLSTINGKPLRSPICADQILHVDGDVTNTYFETNQMMMELLRQNVARIRISNSCQIEHAYSSNLTQRDPGYYSYYSETKSKAMWHAGANVLHGAVNWWTPRSIVVNAGSVFHLSACFASDAGSLPWQDQPADVGRVWGDTMAGFA